MAWSTRARSTGDGRPSYCAAPSTTIACAGFSVSTRSHTITSASESNQTATTVSTAACARRHPRDADVRGGELLALSGDATRRCPHSDTVVFGKRQEDTEIACAKLVLEPGPVGVERMSRCLARNRALLAADHEGAHVFHQRVQQRVLVA